MTLIYIVAISALITFSINGFIYQRTLIRRLKQIDAPLKADKVPSLPKQFFGVIAIVLFNPLLGLLALSRTSRYTMAIGFVRGFINDRVISEHEATEIYRWVGKEFPPIEGL